MSALSTDTTEDFAARQERKARQIAAEPWHYDAVDLEQAYRVLHCSLRRLHPDDPNLLGWVQLLAWRTTLH